VSRSSRTRLGLLGVALAGLTLVVLALPRGGDASDLLDLDAPDDELRTVLRSLAADPAHTAAAVSTLLDWFRADGEPLLDREPDLEWIEAWQLADLEPDDLRALGDPARLLAGLLGSQGSQRGELELDDEVARVLLGRAGGVLSMRTLPCAVEQVQQLGERVPGEGTAVGQVAGAWMTWPVRRAVRRVQVDHAGLTSAALVTLEGATAPTWHDGVGVRLAQRWVLELWVEQTASTSVLFVAAWTEAGSDELEPASRLWDSWELARAWDEGDRWAAVCSGGDPSVPAAPAPAVEQTKAPSPVTVQP